MEVSTLRIFAKFGVVGRIAEGLKGNGTRHTSGFEIADAALAEATDLIGPICPIGPIKSVARTHHALSG